MTDTSIRSGLRSVQGSERLVGDICGELALAARGLYGSDVAPTLKLSTLESASSEQKGPNIINMTQKWREKSVAMMTRWFGVCLLLIVSAWGQDIDVGSTRQLFIDDYAIESMDFGAVKMLNQPLKYEGNPIIQMDRCWEANMHFANAPNLIYDQEERLFKMWNQVVNYDWSTSMLAYYVSRDGIHWEKPQVGQFEFSSPYCRAKPTRKHNFVFGHQVRLGAPGVFKDLHEEDPKKRYKMVYNRSEPKHGAWAAYSPDGIHWADYPYPEVNPIYLANDTHQVVF